MTAVDVQYIVIDAPCLAALITLVDGLHKKGWRAAGGVAFAPEGKYGGPKYMQALTKDTPCAQYALGL